MTLVGGLLLDAAARWPDAEALVDYGEGLAPLVRWSWSTLAREAEGERRRLEALGVGPGDRVALIGRNDARYLARWFGVSLTGATLAPMPAASAPGEIRWRAAHAQIRCLLHDAETAALVARAGGLDLIGPEPACPAPPRAPTPTSAPALLLYTSGTTGSAKGALISHEALVTHTRNVSAHALRLGPGDTVLAALPLSHSFGCRMVMLASAVTGARLVVMARFEPTRAARLLTMEGVTWLPAVPTMLAGLAQAISAPPPALRWCLSAGATLPEAQRSRVSAALGAPVYQGYGMTEATFSTLEAPPASPTPGSVGRPVRGVAVAITDERGRPVPAGERGEVRVRGANTFSGYLDAPEATAQTLIDGWVRSGDVGVLDAEGRLRIVDRLKDLIIRGGYNVYPSEVEGALVAHPEVHQVAVVGVPDARLGEEVVAVVVPTHGAQPSPEALDRWARERVARYKVPRRYVFRSALPLGPSRKVLKRQLRAELTAAAPTAPE